jgi:hypothetical protein
MTKVFDDFVTQDFDWNVLGGGDPFELVVLRADSFFPVRLF